MLGTHFLRCDALAFKHAFVLMLQIEEPFCCEIAQLVLENAETCFGFTFSGVPTEKMDGVCGKVEQVMAELSSGRRELDMRRMVTIIKNQILQILNQVRSRGGA